jgi:DNA-binding PadR family transcriptional regulator
MRDVMRVRYALLALLSEGPKYGLQLREEFEAQPGEVWPLAVGQVDRTLQCLKRALAAPGEPAPWPLPRLRRRVGVRP